MPMRSAHAVFIRLGAQDNMAHIAVIKALRRKTMSKRMGHGFLLAAVVLLFPIATAAQTQDLILPVVLNGYTVAPVHYQTIIRILNTSASAVEVTLEAYQNDGMPIRILEPFPIARSGTQTVFQIEPDGEG